VYFVLVNFCVAERTVEQNSYFLYQSFQIYEGTDSLRRAADESSGHNL